MATTRDQGFRSGFAGFTNRKFKIGANVKCLKGTQAAIARTGGNKGYAVPATAAAGLRVVGRFGETVDNTGGAAGAKTVTILFHRQIECLKMNNDSGTPVTQADFGGVVYIKDNDTVTASASATSISGIAWGIDDIGRVEVEPMSHYLPEQDDAAAIEIQDSANLFTASDLEGALAELAKNVSYIPISLGGCLDAATGAVLAVFANATGTTPGTQLTNSKAVTVRWNNDAAPGAIAVGGVIKPEDIDETAAITFVAHVSKTGATVGDATKLTVGAFENVVGALHDADTDFGGDTTAIVGNATAKTVQEVTLALAAADISSAKGSFTFTIKPKAGTLGTDDLVLHDAYLKVVRKNVPA
jgi:hypothetical protein